MINLEAFLGCLIFRLKKTKPKIPSFCQGNAGAKKMCLLGNMFGDSEAKCLRFRIMLVFKTCSVSFCVLLKLLKGFLTGYVDYSV